MSDLQRYLAALGFMRQRGLIVCQCGREKAFDYLAQITDLLDIAVLANSEVVTASKALNVKWFSSQTLRTQLLGDEFDVVLVDVAAGLPPDGLALLLGALRGGGVAIFLFAEAYHKWPQAACPDYQRMLPYPLTESQSHYRFLIHIKQQVEALLASGQALLLDTLDGLITTRPAKNLPSRVFVPNGFQRTALVQLSNHRGIGLISGPRGAGKSSALGLLAARLLAQGRSVVLLALTQAGRAAVQRAAGGQLPSQAVDQLLALPAAGEMSVNDCVLLIDESAALPVAVIDALCSRFNTVIMASTTEGYEGSGQALTVKLIKRWQKRADFVHCELTQSLRFMTPDPVAELLNSALLLNIEPANEPPARVNVEWRVLSQAQLLADKVLLQQVYGLLKAAHYRTTPDDLRVLLDGVDTHCAVLISEQTVISVCLFVIEGGLDTEISAEIAAGRRRPRGHLLVQRMAQHLADPRFLQQRVARVMRIAVTEPLRRQGLAQLCLRGVEQWLRERGIYWVGSSFSASDEAMGFWLAQGYQLQRMGQRRHPASGELSALVLKALK